MINKTTFQINTYFDLLQKNAICFINGESSHQLLLNIYLKENENFEDVLQEFKFDKEDFIYYLYELEIRLRALRDMYERD